MLLLAATARYNVSVAGIVTLVFIPASMAATVEITELPTYGTSDTFLRGRVTGVDFATHRVAPYDYEEGYGWTTKPTFAEPTVPIDANGEFSIGGLDLLARIFDLQVLPQGVMPIQVFRTRSVPTNPQAVARAFAYRNGPTLAFAGRTWAVKDAPFPADPGNKRFSTRPEDVFVDGGGNLHLTITQRDDNYWQTEVILTESLGYGTYTFLTDYRADILDANATFGGFTWDSFGDDERIPAWPHREVDFEDSRWGNASDEFSSQSVVQFFLTQGNVERIVLPDLGTDARLTRSITWVPGKVQFTTARGHHLTGDIPEDQIIGERRLYVEDLGINHIVPEPGRETFRFNLWLNQPAPAGSTPIEAVINDFAFFPMGDYNRNGRVDAADYVVWRKTLGSTSDLRADGDLSGSVDLADYQLWQANFGAGNLIGPSATSSNVPEPGTLLILFSALPVVVRRLP